MIAIDLDGTLLGPRGEVTPRAKAAVHKALSAGLLVCFATGRNWTESKTVLDAVEHYASAVFAGGAMVIDTRHRVTLHRMMMAPELARDISGVFEAEGHAVLALQDTGAAGVDYLVTGDLPLNAATTQWMGLTDAAVRRVPRLAGHSHEHTVRVGIVAPPDAVRHCMRVLDEALGERIVQQDLAVPAYGVEKRQGRGEGGGEIGHRHERRGRARAVPGGAGGEPRGGTGRRGGADPRGRLNCVSVDPSAAGLAAPLAGRSSRVKEQYWVF
jgi:hypothetical protein